MSSLCAQTRGSRQLQLAEPLRPSTLLPMEQKGEKRGSARPPVGSAVPKDPRRDPMLEVDEALNEWEQVVEKTLFERPAATDPTQGGYTDPFLMENSVSGYELLMMQKKEADALLNAVRNFAVKNNQDPGTMLDEMYTQLTGIERMPTTPTTAASASSTPAPYTPLSAAVTPPAPFPKEHATMQEPDFVIPNDALISWGKMAGQHMEALHADLAYVKWLFGNRTRFKNPEAMMVLQYLDQFYSLEGPKGKTYLRKRGETDGTRSPVIHLPRRSPQPRVSLEEAMPGATTRTPTAATTSGNDTNDLVRALLARMCRD